MDAIPTCKCSNCGERDDRQDSGLCKFCEADAIKTELINFGRHVLRSMHNEETWSGGDMLEDFAEMARRLDLASDDSQGYFRANRKAIES